MIHVGQKLWFVPSQRRNGSAREVTVTKVGRKWATLDNSRHRIDVETLVVDGKGYMSPGRCYIAIVFGAVVVYLFLTRKSKRPYGHNRSQARRHKQSINRLRE